MMMYIIGLSLTLSPFCSDRPFSIFSICRDGQYSVLCAYIYTHHAICSSCTVADSELISERNFRRPVHIRLATHQTMKHGQLGQQYINISPNTNLVFLYAKMQARVIITAASTNPNRYSMMPAAALFVRSAHVTSNCLVNNLPLTFDACALNLATLTTKMAGWSV